MAFINCESMFSLLLYIVTKYIIKCGYHGYNSLYAIVYKSTFQHCVKEIRKNVRNPLKQTENERSIGST